MLRLHPHPSYDPTDATNSLREHLLFVLNTLKRNNQGVKLYAILDYGLTDGIGKRYSNELFIKEDNVQAALLYPERYAEQLESIAPRIVAINPNTEVNEEDETTTWLLKNSHGQNGIIWLYSHYSLIDLAKYYQEHTTAYLEETTKEVLFAFYDPRLLPTTLASLADKDSARLMAPVLAYLHEDWAFKSTIHLHSYQAISGSETHPKSLRTNRYPLALDNWSDEDKQALTEQLSQAQVQPLIRHELPIILANATMQAYEEARAQDFIQRVVRSMLTLPIAAKEKASSLFKFAAEHSQKAYFEYHMQNESANYQYILASYVFGTNFEQHDPTMQQKLSDKNIDQLGKELILRSFLNRYKHKILMQDNDKGEHSE